MLNGVLVQGTVTGVSRRFDYEGGELRRRDPRLFNGGLFVTLDNGRTTFVANETHMNLWWLVR